MVSYRVQPGTQVLTVSGADVYDGPEDNSYISKVQEIFLEGALLYVPLQKGRLDFWFFYTADTHDQSPRFFGANNEHRTAYLGARPLKGTVHMGRVPRTPPGMTDNVTVLIHEAIHSWVLGRFKVNARELPLVAQYTEEMFGGMNYSGPLLLGRQNSHWSPYVDTGGSFMDGTDYTEKNSYRELVEWKANPELSTPKKIPKFDRFIMGLESKNELVQENYSLSYVEPVLTTPCNYHAGIFVAFSPTDYIYFGPYKDHRFIKVETSDGRSLGDQHSAHYMQEIVGKHDGVLLRIVKRADNYYFQARLHWPSRSIGSQITPGEPIPELMSGLETAALDSNPGGVSDSEWRTIAHTNRPTSPQAFGCITKKWGGRGFLSEVSYFDIASVNDGSAYRNLERVRGAESNNSSTQLFDELVSNYGTWNDPSGESIRAFRRDRLFITTPYGTPNDRGTADSIAGDSFDHTSTKDFAPKLLFKALGGENQAFGASVRIERTIFNPWTGLATVSPPSTLIGKKKVIPVRDIELPSYILERQVKPGDTIRSAFILVGKEDSDFKIETINNLELIRKQWDRRLAEISNGDLTSDSKMSSTVTIND